MKTNTYVFINENNDIIVSCYVECPSQDWNWCKSQAAIVVEGVNEDLEELLNEFEGTEPTEPTEPTEEKEEKEVVATEMDTKIEAMLLLEPLVIEKNQNYKPKLTNVKRVVNLSKTPFIDYYHGCGSRYAFVKDNKVVAFYYKGEIVTKKIKDSEGFKVDFSCTQICFTR